MREPRGTPAVWRAFLTRWAGDLPTPFDIFFTGLLLGAVLGMSITVVGFAWLGVVK